jgi:LAO/AO transport system kinase
MNDQKLSAWLQSRKNRKNASSPEKLYSEILKGKIDALSLAITLLESSNSTDKKNSKELINLCLPHSGKSIRIGITGVPGVGKSSFIEEFGLYLISNGKKVAVLAIDPSSEKSKGSILGDKTRMNGLSIHESAFVRPSPAGDSLGGVARKTRESIYLCEAAGFDVILIETVGVGQSETAVHSMVDFFLLLMLSGAGDELQGIKRGIMEMADALVITKADGDNVRKANIARQEYENALHLFPQNKNNWTPKVMTCSSLEKRSIDKIEFTIQEYVKHTQTNSSFYKKRHEQDRFWMLESLKESILADFFENESMKLFLNEFSKDVEEGKLSSFDAAEKLYEKYKKLK